MSVAPCNIAKFKQIQLPFSTIPAILAENGWILENWPEDVPFPCDLQQGKGIAGLKACYREPLLRALDDQHYPIKVVKRYTEGYVTIFPGGLGLTLDFQLFLPRSQS